MASEIVSNTVRFPRAKKRGAKVTHGPMATLLAFPALLTGAALEARWAWLWQYRMDWHHESLEGTFEDPRDWEGTIAIRRGLAPMLGPFDDESDIRREVAEYEAVIRNRVALKDWLETLGIDWARSKTQEDALYFLANYVKGRTNG